jgi:hypothetical protein
MGLELAFLSLCPLVRRRTLKESFHADAPQVAQHEPTVGRRFGAAVDCLGDPFDRDDLVVNLKGRTALHVVEKTSL